MFGFGLRLSTTLWLRMGYISLLVVLGLAKSMLGYDHDWG